MQATLSFRGVRIGFDEGDIVDNLSFEVFPKETVVLLGETGTRKTLTLKMAAGLLRPLEGEINVLGKHVTGMTERNCSISGAESVLCSRKARFSIRCRWKKMSPTGCGKKRCRKKRSSQESEKRCDSWSWSMRSIRCLPNSPEACAGAPPSRGR